MFDVYARYDIAELLGLLQQYTNSRRVPAEMPMLQVSKSRGSASAIRFMVAYKVL